MNATDDFRIHPNPMKSPFLEMTEGCAADSFNLDSKDADIRELREKLERSERKNAEYTEQLERHKLHTKQLLLGWKLKQHTSNDIIASQAREKDHQLSEIMSDLMYFESRLMRQKKTIQEQARAKDQRIQELERTIKKQQKQINALNRANERLISSLHDLRERSASEDAPSESESDSDDTIGERQSADKPYYINGVCDREGTTGANQTGKIVAHRHSKNDSKPNSFAPLQLNHSRARGRKYSDVNGMYRSNHINERNNNVSRSPPHRVRFTDDVRENESPRDFPKVKKSVELTTPVLRLRKISLPAYRLPLQYDEDEQYI